MSLFSNPGPRSECNVSGGPNVLINYLVVARSTGSAALSRTGESTESASGSPSPRERIYIQSLWLKLIPMCTQLSQPILFEMAGQEANDMSGACALWVLFRVIDRRGN